MNAERARYRLLIDLPDRPGIVAAVTTFLGRYDANVLELDSHAVGSPPRFYMRVEFDVGEVPLDERGFTNAFDAEVGRVMEVGCRELWRVDRRKHVCLLVSRYDHCLIDLLTRWRQGELPCEIGLVVSNHPDLEDEVRRFGVEYRHIPVERGARAAAEADLLAAAGGRYDLLVLARYMQILSGDFLARIGAPTINIHHSFLPAFAGADPYARAKERGVKIIGATAHYVTEELDGGPIIEQDIVRVNHRASVAEMTRAGRDVERAVLARAVRWHLEDRVAVHGNSTMVFA
jgi:formyltetrahydrofolate deformylase